MGVLYHLRHPLLALDLLHEHVVADLLVAQSMLRGSSENIEVPPDFPFWQSQLFDDEQFPRMYFIEKRYANDPTNWWIPNRACFEAMLRSAGFEILDHPEDEVFICVVLDPPERRGLHLPSHDLEWSLELRERASGDYAMIEAVMFWNEPNNKSHWDFEVDPDWSMFAAMVKLAAEAVRAENGKLLRVLGGISPIDPEFIKNMDLKGVLSWMDVVAVHGFPLDWNHWTIDEWPNKIQVIRDVTILPIWVSEVGASTVVAEKVQEFGLRRSAELLVDLVPRIHWYSLYDL